MHNWAKNKVHLSFLDVPPETGSQFDAYSNKYCTHAAQPQALQTLRAASTQQAD
jgi:hypothetical protein